jgi:hypothetical protein
MVLYNGQNTPLWASNTQNRGPGPYRLHMQGDSNLVLYASNNQPIWASNTSGGRQGSLGGK